MKKNIYIYIYITHFAVLKKLTQHCKSTVLQYNKKKKNIKNTVPSFPEHDTSEQEYVP